MAVAIIVSFGLIDKCPKNIGENNEIIKKILAIESPKKKLTTFFNPKIPNSPVKKFIK